MVKVSLRIPYDEPRTEWRAYAGRRGQPLKSGRDVPVFVTRYLELSIPSRVAGDSYEGALTEWHRQIAYWTSVVEEASVTACSHCNGHGYVAVGAEEHQRAMSAES
jgi:hypothetical protein